MKLLDSYKNVVYLVGSFLDVTMVVGFKYPQPFLYVVGSTYEYVIHCHVIAKWQGVFKTGIHPHTHTHTITLYSVIGEFFTI